MFQCDYTAVLKAWTNAEDVSFEVRDIKQKILLVHIDNNMKPRIEKLQKLLGEFSLWSDGNRHTPDFLRSNIRSRSRDALTDFWYTERLLLNAELWASQKFGPIESLQLPVSLTEQQEGSNRQSFKTWCAAQYSKGYELAEFNHMKTTVTLIFQQLDSCGTTADIDRVMETTKSNLTVCGW